MFRRIICSIGCVCLLVAMAFAAGIDGQWKSEMTTPNGQTFTSTYNLKAEGSSLTGTVVGRMGEAPIVDGKVNGDEFSFAVVRERQGQEFRIEYKGVVSGDELKLTISFGSDFPPREIVAKRVQ